MEQKMNTRENTSIIRKIISGMGICALVAFFCFTDTGRDIIRSGSGLFGASVAESAIRPEVSTTDTFRTALESEIYLPQEVDLTAGSNLISQNEASAQGNPAELTALLDGAGHQCNFRDHMSGAVALNNQPGCI